MKPKAAAIKTLLMPEVDRQVLSKSSAAFDRGDKFADYQTIPSLEEYGVDSSATDAGRALFCDIEKDVWLPHVHRAKDQVRFKSIGFACPIEALYEKVDSL